MRKPKRAPKTAAAATVVVCTLSLLLPILVGGCPDLRNGVVDAFETATRAVLLSNEPPEVALETAARSVFDALLDVLFDQLRTETTRRSGLGF